MSTSAAGILPASSGAPVPSSGPAAPALPPSEVKRKYEEAQTKPSARTLWSPISSALVEQAKYIDAFNPMMTIIAGFRGDVEAFREAAGHARQNDTTRSQLKHKTNYVLSDRRKRLDPPISDSTVNSDRGIKHPMLRDALVPWSRRLKINEAPFGHGGAGGGNSHAASSASCDAQCRCCAASGPPLTPDAVADDSDSDLEMTEILARRGASHQFPSIILLMDNAHIKLSNFANSLYHALLRVLQRCACSHLFPLVSRKNQAVPPLNASSALLSIQSEFSRTDRFSASCSSSSSP
ncbi:hypothetical protein FB451DRAFT_1564711 [Mycena latifolia]|nr:hypothetical protein FB451DRAFT_1564711 [Mycena latifolia]